MGRSPCCEKAHTNKGAWTKEEDSLLVTYIRAHGEGCWRSLPKDAGLQRCGKSCRLRWINYLRPDLKRGNFSVEEDDVIIRLHRQLGNKWSQIASHLPGRTDNEIKNYWNTHIRRKLANQGGSSTTKATSPCSSTTVTSQTEQTPSWLPEAPRGSESALASTSEGEVGVNLDLSISLPWDLQAPPTSVEQQGVEEEEKVVGLCGNMGGLERGGGEACTTWAFRWYM